MTANPFSRPIAFRFYFRNWMSGYTVYASHFADALSEVTEFVSHTGVSDPGPIDLYINGQSASLAQAA